MAATVLIREKNGAGETATDKTTGTVRFKNADDALVDTANRLIVPAAGQEYSYEKWLRLHIGATGPSVDIQNLQFYMDGANGFGTGVKLWAATDATYSTPVVPLEANATPEHDAVAMTDAFTYTSVAPLSLGAGPYSTINTDMGSYLVLVMEVETTAAPGSLTSETATFSYDET